MGLIIRSSAIHAAGCYTTTAVRKGTRVAEYTGPRLSKDEADSANEESPITYLFGLGDGSIVIDGHCMAMFINHSCDPNSFFDTSTLQFIALKQIDDAGHLNRSIVADVVKPPGRRTRRRVGRGS